MARNFSARKRRSKPFLPAQQRILSQFFTPRSGISKDDVNFLAKPLNKVGGTSNVGFKEVNIKQQPVNVGPGNLNQVTTVFTTAWELHQGNWSHGCNPTGQCNKGSVYEKNSTLSALNYQPTDVDLAANTLTSVHSRDLCKQTVETRESLMASKLRASSSSRSVSVQNSASSSTATRRGDKRVRKLTSGSKSYEKSGKKQKSEHMSIVLRDSSTEDDDDDCSVTVKVRHGSEAKNAIQVEIESSDSSDGESNCQSSKTSSNHAVTQSSSQSTRCGSSSGISRKKENSSTRSSTSSNSCPKVRKNKAPRSTFGLTGADSSESDTDVEESCTSFGCLPVEIMENIFCQLPVVDLLLNCVLVCHQWHDVISSESFIPWKKKYFQLKNRVSTCEDEMVKLVDEEQLLELDLFPLHLGRFMGNFRRSRDARKLRKSLKKHSKFHLIKSFLETLTEGADSKPSPWSVVSLLTLVSETVYEVQEIVRCLVKSNSCLVQDIIECFYCLASIFFLLETQHRIGSGPHYRVFYTLYLFENVFQATRASIGSVFQRNETGQQSLMKYTSPSDRLQLTHEQVRITKHNVSPGEIIKIVAFAGTGKTTTLVEYTKMRPMKKFLNVAYNKSIQEHAEKLFPSNVESRTVHSLAYRAKGFRYRHKLAPCLRLSAIMNALPDKCGFLYARRVEDTLKNFIASTSSVVEAKHVPPVTSSAVMVSFGDASDIVEQIFGNNGTDLSYLSGEKHIKKVVSHAEMLWQRMKDQGDKDIPITHDGYLKLYQLSRPVLHGYDCLLIDEAQDCTPAAADVLLRQDCAKILVGDPHQQIYAFRGARNALQEVTGTHTFYLTQSFRFGPEIAYVTACVLDVLKGVRNKTLVGGAKPGYVLGDRKGQLCIITRCNYTLFNEAVQVCCSRNETRVAFVGGIRGLALDRVLDIHKLFTAGTNNGSLYIKDNLIRKFRSFFELKKYAKVATDAELMGKIKIVETHHVMLQQRIEKIKSKTCHEIQQADIVFSTAHKAKGLEFETVRLTDDFLASTEIGVSIHDFQEDDKNLVYVAVSRAKKCLQLTPTLLRILAEKKEHFLKVVSYKQTNQGEEAFLCASCRQSSDVLSKDAHVFVQKKEVVLGGNIRMPGGTLGPLCALNHMPQLGCLVGSTLGKTDQSASSSISESD